MRQRILKEIAWGNAFLLSLEPIIILLAVGLLSTLLLGAWGCWGLPSMHHEVFAEELQGLLQSHASGEDIRQAPGARKYLTGGRSPRVNTRAMERDLARHQRAAKENRLFIRIRRGF